MSFLATVSLAAGVHKITIAMDLNHGTSWGFFLRMRRSDLSAVEIRNGAFALPVYSI